MKKFKIFKILFALILGLGFLSPITNVSAQETSDSLADGEYSVSVALWHATNDQASMAKDVLVEEARLVVSNGVHTVYLSFQTATIYTMSADLDALSYYDDSGDLVSGIVESTRLVSDVEKPEVISFTLPVAGTMYTNVRVFYMGNDGSDARIRIDYSTIAGIVNKTELTSKVTNALAITADGYTAESFAALQTAITVAQDVLANTDATQAEINAQLTALQAAIDALVLDDTGEENPGGEEDDTLKDGIYEVPVNLWHATEDKASMAASALVGTARLVVEGGESKMYLYTQEMTFGTITASLQELKISNNMTRSYTLADVETRDSNGNPTSFSFALPHFEEYISVKVNPKVEMMGNQDIDARIKVDYSNLKSVSDDVDLSKAPNATNTTNGATTNSAQTVATGDAVSYMPYMTLALLAIVVGIYTNKKYRVYE
ncbi:MAG: NEAT domain-containing protein [Coprobacillaceae bacterium]